MRFTNKICIVTGAGSGIGRAIAVRLASEGGCIYVVDLNEAGAQDTVNLINNSKGEAVLSVCDVGNEEDIKRTVASVIARWKKVDVLINDAAMMTFKKIIDLSSAEWDQLMDVNLRSVFLFCKYCIPHMNNGSIVNISSVHAHETTANVVPYASSKGGMEAFIRGVSQEYPQKLRINCVAPGAVDTPMLHSNPNVISGKETIKGKVGKPEEIAAAVCFLASDEASFVNGTTLVVDGGRLDRL